MTRRRKTKAHKPPPRCPETLDLEDWLADQPPTAKASPDKNGEADDNRRDHERPR